MQQISEFGPEGNRTSNDAQAWKQNPDYNWVYNKLRLTRSQGIDCAPWPIEPPSFPVFYKPIMNLKGYAIGGFKATEPPERACPGHFWQPYREGEHWTFDAYWNGDAFENVDGYAVALKENDRYRRWGKSTLGVERSRSWAQDHLPAYDGVINFEGIGDTIIECHLRHSDQIARAREAFPETSERFIELVYRPHTNYTLDCEALREADCKAAFVWPQSKPGADKDEYWMGDVIAPNRSMLRRGVELFNSHLTPA